MAGTRIGINRGAKNPNFKHGMSETRQYQIWQDMLRRCEREYISTYHHYGGRGIKVCDRWHDFNNFWNDMKQGYASNLTLERINNDGDYKKSNCRWVTMQEQSYNKRNTRYITIGGVSKSLSEWAKDSSVKPSTIRQRYYVYNWTAEKSLGIEV